MSTTAEKLARVLRAAAPLATGEAYSILLTAGGLVRLEHRIGDRVEWACELRQGARPPPPPPVQLALSVPVEAPSEAWPPPRSTPELEPRNDVADAPAIAPAAPPRTPTHVLATVPTQSPTVPTPPTTLRVRLEITAATWAETPERLKKRVRMALRGADLQVATHHNSDVAVGPADESHPDLVSLRELLTKIGIAHAVTPVFPQSFAMRTAREDLARADLAALRTTLDAWHADATPATTAAVESARAQITADHAGAAADLCREYFWTGLDASGQRPKKPARRHPARARSAP